MLPSSAAYTEAPHPIHAVHLLHLQQARTQGLQLPWEEEEPYARSSLRFCKQDILDTTHRRSRSTHPPDRKEARDAPYAMTVEYFIEVSKLQYRLTTKSFCSSKPQQTLNLEDEILLRGESVTSCIFYGLLNSPKMRIFKNFLCDCENSQNNVRLTSRSLKIPRK